MKIKLLLIALIFQGCVTYGDMSSSHTTDSELGDFPSVNEVGYDINDLDSYIIDETDSDGDGVYDSIETELGSDPNDPNSVPDLSGEYDVSGLSADDNALGIYETVAKEVMSFLMCLGLNARTPVCAFPTGKGNAWKVDSVSLGPVGSTYTDEAGESIIIVANKKGSNGYKLTYPGSTDIANTGHYKVSGGRLYMVSDTRGCIYIYSMSVNQPCIIVPPTEVNPELVGFTEAISVPTTIKTFKIDSVSTMDKKPIMGTYQNVNQAVLNCTQPAPGTQRTIVSK